MKKVLLIISMFLIPMSFDANNSRDCNRDVYLENINSNNVLDYLEVNNMSINEICAKDYCENINGSLLYKSLNKFTNNYLDYLKKDIDNDTYLSIYLKGFKIYSIKSNYCI